jgi:hypothetical protein
MKLVILYFMNVLTPLLSLITIITMMSLAPRFTPKDKIDIERDKKKKKTGLIYY